MSKQYVATVAEISQLREILALPDLQDFQVAVQDWFRTKARTTPATVAILLAWADSSADVAFNKILQAMNAGISFVPTGDTSADELYSDLKNYRADLAVWRKENQRGLDEFPNRLGGDQQWQDQVAFPLLYGLFPDGTDTYPQFLEGKMLQRAASVSVEALNEAQSQFWDDVLENAAATAESVKDAASLGLGTVAGVAVALFAFGFFKGRK